ncbi:transporter substrate-binding domain-containing protein [Vibrio kyushuensis]|uniref:substrate-binding periplasmic protein n=1 Tax=Vibrio kyushuensis TaxID=2910249 RepID=UPI003D0A77CD
MKFIVGLLLFSQYAFSEVLIAHCRDRPPELQITQDGCGGPVAEMIELAVLRIGHEVKWVNVPWARTINTAKSGMVDIIPRHSISAERRKFLHAVSYGCQVRHVSFIVKLGSDIKIEDSNSLSSYRVGVIRGSFYSNSISKRQYSGLHAVDDNEQLISMLLNNRIDIAITSSDHGVEIFKAQEGLAELDYKEKFHNSRYISMPKQSDKSRYYSDFGIEILEMRLSGEVAKIFSKHNLPPPEQNCQINKP